LFLFFPLAVSSLQIVKLARFEEVKGFISAQISMCLVYRKKTQRTFRKEGQVSLVQPTFTMAGQMAPAPQSLPLLCPRPFTERSQN